MVVQAELLLHLLVSLLHRPAALPEADRLDPAGAARQVRQGVLDLAVGLLLDQQPHRLGPGAIAGGPAAAGPDPQPREPTRELALGPLTPGHLPQRRHGGQLLEADRSGRIRGQSGPLPRPAGGGARRLDPVRGLGEDDHLLGHTHDVGETPTGQPLAERPRDAIASVGHHEPAGQPLGSDLVEQLQGDLPLGQRATMLLGHPGPVQPRGVAQPGLGKVEPHRQGMMALRRDVVDRGCDLAVGLLARGPAVLPLHPDGVRALLGEAGVVDDEDARRGGKCRGHGRAITPPDGLLVPGALADELLEGLVQIGDDEFGREDDLPRERFDALPLAVEDQPLEVDAGVLGLSGPVEVVAEERGVRVEPIEDFGSKFGGVGAIHALDTNQPILRFVAVNGVVLEALTKLCGSHHIVVEDAEADIAPGRPRPRA